jgi:hypothetical protein
MAHYGLEEEHLAAIGRVCVSWSVMDSTLSYLVSTLAGVDDVLDSSALTGPMKMGEKIEIARALGHQKLSPENFHGLDQLLNAIDGTLRTERNRIVHDDWSADPDTTTPTRLNSRPRYEKRPNQPRSMVYFTQTDQDTKEVVLVASLIDKADFSLMAAAIYALRDRTKDEPHPWPDIFSGPLSQLHRYRDHIAKSRRPPPQPSRE